MSRAANPSVPGWATLERRDDARGGMSRPSGEFEQLIERYGKLMSSAVRRVCARKNAALVPDVEQEVRLALWRHLERGGEIEHPGAYLYRMALTTALRELRRVRGERPLEESEPPEVPPPPRGLEPPEQSRLIEQALGTLEPDQSRAVRAYLMGFNHREVATLFGWSESVGRHRIYRGLERLRRELGGDLGERRA